MDTEFLPINGADVARILEKGFTRIEMNLLRKWEVAEELKKTQIKLYCRRQSMFWATPQYTWSLDGWRWWSAVRRDISFQEYVRSLDMRRTYLLELDVYLRSKTCCVVMDKT